MKHAFLILAHNEPYILEVLLGQLSKGADDIYVHVDKKVADEEFDKIKSICVAYGGVQLVSTRIDVRWGDSSMLEAEFILFKEASKTYHDFYHLLSGVDLAIKPLSVIHDFFDKHSNEIFMTISDTDVDKRRMDFCVNYYHPFTRLLRKKIIGKLFFKLDDLSVYIQRLFCLKRNTRLNLFKGHQWMSLPHDFMLFLLSKEKYILSRFKYTCCADEIAIQTILMDSEYKKRLYVPTQNQNAALRLIDWNRGEPYVWKKDDIEEIMNSNNFFARKFSSFVDRDIVDFIKLKCS